MSLLTIIRWLVANWKIIAKVIESATELVQEINRTDLSGEEKRLAVVAKLKEEFGDLGLSWLNVVVELVVSVLRWRKAI